MLILLAAISFAAHRTAAQQFSCSGFGQTPVLTPQGTNQICSAPGAANQCPANAICTTAANSPNTFICCTSNASPICPNNAVPQSSPTGFVTCQIFNPSTCNAGFSCVPAANNPQLTLCCSATQSQGTCPANFAPALDAQGNSIECTPAQPAGCPAGSVCTQATANSQFLCCRSSIAPRVCPNNQNALLTPSGSLETCSGPGAQCSNPAYSCQLSTVVAQFVCCGGVSTGSATCVDGRQTFQQFPGQTFTCNALLNPTGCPFGYDCAQSTQPGTSVCCLSATTTTPPPGGNQQCPIGWSAFQNEVTRETRSCSGVFDMSCPAGFSCTPTLIQSQFICCRLASALTCINGLAFLANGHPRLCSTARVNQCPRGYSCQQSTNPTVSICCTASTTTFYQRDISTFCGDGTDALQTELGVVECPLVGQSTGCPLGYTCQLGSNGSNVCCLSFVRRYSAASRCLRRTTLLRLSHPVPCTDDEVCGVGFECSDDTSDGHRVCCVATTTFGCRSGSTPQLDSSGFTRRCFSLDSSDCGDGFRCVTTDVVGVRACCFAAKIRSRTATKR